MINFSTINADNSASRWSVIAFYVEISYFNLRIFSIICKIILFSYKITSELLDFLNNW